MEKERTGAQTNEAELRRTSFDERLLSAQRAALSRSWQMHCVAFSAVFFFQLAQSARCDGDGAQCAPCTVCD